MSVTPPTPDICSNARKTIYPGSIPKQLKQLQHRNYSADLLLHYNYGAAAVKQWGKKSRVIVLERAQQDADSTFQIWGNHNCSLHF
jgi:hypothetical protein